VQRALQLIEAGALDGKDVADLAERLGVGDRHLRRLFAEHLGTSPLAVAQTRRVLFAKQLIADTSLPMSRIAVLAGFANVRRFNAAMQRVYERPPRELRRNRSRARTSAVELHLAYRPPLAWEAMLAFLRQRAIAGLEVITDTTWSRAIEIDGVAGIVEVGPSRKPHHLRARIDLPQATGVWPTVRRLRSLFDLDADPQRIQEDLQRHARLRDSVARTPGLRIPGCWNAFELVLRAILGQQVSVKGATTLATRLVERWGTKLPQPLPGLERTFPSPAVLSGAKLDRIGLTTARAQALQEVARAAHNGTLAFDDVTDSVAIREQLQRIRGVGEWTVEYIAMRALREPDAFPASDLGLRYALSDNGKPAAVGAVRQEAEAWRPWRGYAALYLWKELADAHQAG
jgi:AraC family transcriptional regulator of adaptative response / DNA-3-methyladenine glycosylase II